MTRYLYAASPADYVVDGTTGLPVPNAVVTVWTARTGGSQVTDLQNLSSQAITQVTADSSGFLAFYGPDNMTDNLWLYSGSGSRLVVRATVNSTPAGTALALSGGTLTGALTLAGAPTQNLHPATKQYVDTAVSGFVAKSGDTMTGSLRTHQASLKVSGDASTYVFARRQGDGTGYGFHLGATSTVPLSATLYDSGGNALTAALNYSASSTRWNITGDTYITGALTATGNASLNGTLSVGGNVSMGSHKITGLSAGTANGDSVRFEQVLRVGNVQSGRVSGYTYPTGGYTITFPTAFTSAPYVVITQESGNYFWMPQSVTATNFKVCIINTSGTQVPNGSTLDPFHWIAFGPVA